MWITGYDVATDTVEDSAHFEWSSDGPSLVHVTRRIGDTRLNEPWGLESLYQTADGYYTRQVMNRELIADVVGWESIQKILLQRFLCGYQEALDARAAASESSTTSVDVVVLIMCARVGVGR